MANELRIKRRVSGIAGAPASLKTAELAWNMVDDTVYGGKGDDGGGVATSVVALMGPGAFVDRSSAQSIGGAKTFLVSPIVPTPSGGDNSTKSANTAFVQSAVASKAPLNSPTFTGAPKAPTPTGGDNSTNLATTAFVQDAIGAFGAGDMSKSTYDTTDNGIVDRAEVADAVAWNNVSGKPTNFAPAAHVHPIGEVTGLQSALDGKAPLASPAFTGAPTAPTATAGTSTTQLATTAFVAAAVAALVDGAPGAIDTLNELAAALGDDPNFATTVTNGLASKLANASNLSDLADAAAARGNLGLASMAQQAASAVNITGGDVSGITLDSSVIDGGTF